MTNLDQIVMFLYDLYLNATPLVLFDALLSLIYILPLIICIRAYKKTGSLDYLILGIIIASMTLNYLVAPLDEFALYEFDLILAIVNQIIMGGTYTIANSLFLLHCIRLRWDKPQSWILYGGTLFSLFIGFDVVILRSSSLLVSFDLYWYEWPVIFWLIEEIFSLTVSFLMLYSYTTTKKVVKTKSTSRAILLWKIYASLAIVLDTIVITTLFIDYGPTFFAIFETIWPVFHIISLIILFILAFQYPESLLISEAQVLRACKLYRLIKQDEKIELGWKLDHIPEYFKKIPPSLFEMRCEDATETSP